MQHLRNPPPHPSARYFNLAVAALVFAGMLVFGAWVAGTAVVPALRGTGDVRLVRLVSGLAWAGAGVMFLAAVWEEWRTGEPFQHGSRMRIALALMGIGVAVLSGQTAFFG